MLRRLVLAIVFAVGVLCLGGLLHDTVTSCTLVNAYDPNGTLCQGAYITIQGTDNNCNPTQECYSETFTTCYIVKVGTSCGATNGACSSVAEGRVWGNNLSGSYQITSYLSGCLKLCACTP